MFEDRPLNQIPRKFKIVPGTCVLERYIADKPIGFGGTATVWGGRVKGSNMAVAMKVSHPNQTTGQRHEERLEREFQILSRICSPFVVAATDYGLLDDGRPVLVCEMMQGTTLRDYLRTEKSLSLAATLDLTVQLLRALTDVHACGVAHRDIKPDNIMVTDTPQALRLKLFDFGIAKVIGDTVDGISPEDDAEVAELFQVLTAAEMTVGTPEYMAPEQISATHVGAYTDLYAVGILMHEMLFGEVPYTGKTFFEIAHRHLEGILPPLPADLPECIQQIIWRALASEPSQRYSSAETMILDIGEAAREPAVARYDINEVDPDESGPWASVDVDVDNVRRAQQINRLRSLIETPAVEPSEEGEYDPMDPFLGAKTQESSLGTETSDSGYEVLSEEAVREGSVTDPGLARDELAPWDAYESDDQMLVVDPQKLAAFHFAKSGDIASCSDVNTYSANLSAPLPIDPAASQSTTMSDECEFDGQAYVLGRPTVEMDAKVLEGDRLEPAEEDIEELLALESSLEAQFSADSCSEVVVLLPVWRVSEADLPAVTSGRWLLEEGSTMVNNLVESESSSSSSIALGEAWVDLNASPDISG